MRHRRVHSTIWKPIKRQKKKTPGKVLRQTWTGQAHNFKPRQEISQGRMFRTITLNAAGQYSESSTNVWEARKSPPGERLNSSGSNAVVFCESSKIFICSHTKSRPNNYSRRLAWQQASISQTQWSLKSKTKKLTPVSSGFWRGAFLPRWLCEQA
jgi:hypothetical protein